MRLRTWIIILLAVLLIGGAGTFVWLNDDLINRIGFGSNEPEQNSSANDLDAERGEHDVDSHKDAEDLENDRTYSLTLYEIDGDSWIHAQELANAIDGSYEYDDINMTLSLEFFQIPFYMVEGVRVVERNGLYLPYEIDLMIGDEEDDVYLPVDFLQHALEVDPDIDEEQDQVVFTIDDEAEEVFSAIEEEGVSLEGMEVEDLIEHLSFLSNPIPGAQISTQASHLPGAPREYRNGYHEGIDWYSGTSGREIDLNTEVLSVADGVIVRVDSDYEEYDIEEREWELQISAQQDDTPEYILDNLRGRSVWVQYDAGVMIRYAHLSDIAPELEVGDEIQRGGLIGYVGNSGTSFSVEGDETGGLHLHADLLIYGELFWTYIHNEEDIREVLENTFSDDPEEYEDVVGELGN